MHLRPADFFTSNPALDVPSARNDASVLVPCCAQNTGSSGEYSTPKEDKSDFGQSRNTKTVPVQEDPVSHLQSGRPDIDAKKAGANVDGAGEKDGLKRRLSKAAQRFLGGGDKDAEQKQ